MTTTKTAPVTYISRYARLNVGGHQFENHRFTTNVDQVIEQLDARIARGGRVAFARADEADLPEIDESVEKQKVEPVDWSDFPHIDLKRHAKDAGITGTSKMNKADLVDALSATDHRPG